MLLSLACLALVGCGGGVSKEFAPQEPVTQWSNADWQTVLENAATADGFVKYDVLTNNTASTKDALYRYVALVGTVSPEKRPELFPTSNDRLAYYINAYNSICMYAVLKRGLPGNVLYSGGFPGSIFLFDKFPVGGKKMSLHDLETNYVRSTGDPRIHFALNCMSYSCPPLRKEAYEGGKLDAQLADQGRRYLSDPRGAVAEGTNVKLSEIFTKLYPGDFTSAYEKKSGKSNPDLLESIRPFAGPDSPVHKATSYSTMPYDWSLNRAR
jgi:hypothetical protein